MSQPRVRDLSQEKREMVVDVHSHPAYDLLASLWVCSDEETQDYEVGREWFDALREGVSPAIRSLWDDVSIGMWVALMGLVVDLPDESGIDAFFEKLEASDPVDVRMRFIAHKRALPPEARPIAERAAQGDVEAVEELASLEMYADWKRWQDALRTTLTPTPEATLSGVIQVLRAVYEAGVREREGEFAAATRRDADAKRAMATRLSGSRLIELATNGVTLEASADRRPVVLVPSVVMRPWVLITEHPEARVLIYPVADEYLDADPDAPPAWLVGTFKALGDEKRLRIMRRLGEGPAALGEIAELLDVSKSTAHHHLRLLRTAGLVRITLGADKEYSLRRDVVPEAAAILNAYIGTH